MNTHFCSRWSTPALLLVALLYSTCGVATAATRTVTNTNDSGPGSLRQTIASAAIGDTIEVAVSGTITLTSGALFISKDLTVNGPGAANLTISGNNAGRVITIVTNNGTVNISGLTLTQGTALVGGGLSNSGTTVTLNDCVITGNSAERMGAGIFSSRFIGPSGDVFGNLHLNRCTVSNNHATTTSGEFGGGGIRVEDGTLTINDSSITGNSALNGGGIHSVAAVVTINNCSISSNRTITPANSGPMRAGGGLYADRQGTVSIHNSTLESNAALSLGGAIFNIGQLTITNSTLSQNTAGAGTVYGAGGAIASTSMYGSAGLVLVNSTLYGNSASQGGALFNTGQSTSNVRHSTISGNRAAAGAGIYWVYGSSLTVYSSIVASNIHGDISGNDYAGPLIPTVEYSMIGGDAKLGPLLNNGGPTRTLRPMRDSPAIDAGSCGTGVTAIMTDQRGKPRPHDFPAIPNARDACDMGAVELEIVTVRGRITTSAGAAVPEVAVMLDGAGRSTFTDSEGFYAFRDVLPGNYTITPSLAGHYFSPAQRAITVGINDVLNQDFTGARLRLIYGRISDSRGVALENVSVTRTGSDVPVLTNNAGYYTFRDVREGTYTITPTFAGYYFSPPARTVTIAGADAGNINFIGARYHSIYGRVSDSRGQPLENASVTRSGSSTPALTNNAGYYTFRNVPDGTYTITPLRSGYFFTPSSRTVTVAQADAGAQNFVGATGYNVYGRIYTSNGSGVAGVEVMLSDGRSTPVLTNTAGYYTFRNVAPGTHIITPSASTHTFAPSSREVTVTQSDVATQNFVATMR